MFNRGFLCYFVFESTNCLPFLLCSTPLKRHVIKDLVNIEDFNIDSLEALSGLSDKQRSFVIGYVLHRNQFVAMKLSDYDVDPKYIKQSAWRLMSKDNIKAAIKALSKEVYSQSVATVAELMMVLTNQVRADVKDLFDEEGNILPFDKMDQRTRDAIEHIEAKTHYVGGELSGITHKLRMASKREAAIQLLKIFGAYENGSQGTQPVPTILQNNPLQPLSDGAEGDNSTEQD